MARMEISARSHLQTRLQSILSSISRATAEPSLYTKVFPKEKVPSLVALFDNGIDPDPAYSGSIIGRVYLDAEKNLCLATWPLGKNRAWRKEILLPRVQSFEFEFLGTKNGAEKKEKMRSITTNLAWRTVWAPSHEETPSIIRLKIEEEKETLYFAFILPFPEPFVTYHERRAI